MSRLFWDEIIDTKDLEKKVSALSRSSEEKQELWALVDEIIHHKVIGCILDKLPPEHHEEFLEHFSQKPHDPKIWEMLKAKATHDIEIFIIKEVRDLADEILNYIETPKKHG